MERIVTVPTHRLRSPALILALFVCAHTLLSVDRGAMGILNEPIKRAFALSDSEIGLLSGLAFSIFFGIGGIPLGMLVDRVNRCAILAGSIFVFSAMTVATGLAGNFAQLFVIRSLVGAGEAGGAPSMGSILADIYPPEKRARAMSIFYVGNPLGAILAFLVGGAIATNFGWRPTLLAAGLPGLFLAALCLLVLPEPTRRTDSGRADSRATPPIRETLALVAGKPALRHILFTPVVTSAASAAMFSFSASFFIRSYHLTLSQAGLLLAISYGILGAVSTLVGGSLVDRLARDDERWRPWFCALANLVAAAAVPVMTLSPNFLLSVVGLGLFAIAVTSTYGPVLAMVSRWRRRGCAAP